MPSRFSFDGALMFAFRAAHVRSFPWIFSAAFAGAFTAFFLIETVRRLSLHPVQYLLVGLALVGYMLKLYFRSREGRA